MGDRFDGALAGGSSTLSPELTVPLALRSLSLHETLVTADEDGNLALFRAVQDAKNGGLMYTSEHVDWDDDTLKTAIKKSQMTSMLMDSDRCSKYAKAIGTVISNTPHARVLDIGAGTGLLSMLAARAGADHVDAIEMFAPLARLSNEIIQANGMQNVISIHPARSIDVGLLTDSEGQKGDGGTAKAASESNENCAYLQQRANVIVTEIFDSALLGEACLSAIADSRKRLSVKGSVVIPARATVYARVASSDFLRRFHDLGANFELHRSDSGRFCAGGATAVPMHLDALEEGRDYVWLTETFEAFTFDFAGDDLEKYDNRARTITIQRTAPGSPEVVIAWWELDLLGDCSVTYSTESGRENWQDHWLQMIYPLPYDTVEHKSGPITMSLSHDHLSLYFRCGLVPGPQVCSCGWHALPCTPYRIYELGLERRMQTMSKNIVNAVELASRKGFQSLRCIDVSDGTLCGVLAARYAEKVGVNIEVVSADDDELSAFVYTQVAQRVVGGLGSVQCEFEPLYIVAQRERDMKVNDSSWKPFDIFLSEPYFVAMQQYPIATLGNLIVLHRITADLMRDDFISIPGQAQIVAQLFHMADDTIQKGFSKVGVVEGIDHSVYDDLWSESSVCSEPSNERISLPLFQYRSDEVSAVTCVQSIQFSNIDEEAFERPRHTRIRVSSEANSANMIAFWVMYDNTKVSRVQRYEVIFLDDNYQKSVSRSGGLDVCSQWMTDESEWNIRIEKSELIGPTLGG